MITGICVIALLSGYPLLWVYLIRRAKAVFMRGTQVLAEQNAALTIEVERARAVADDERDKRSRYFKKISDFEQERTEWQRLYHEQSIGHGNAQALMMTTIENMARALDAKGVRFQIPRVLHAVREEFLEQHEMPARAAIDAIERIKASPQPTAETHPVLPE